ncbi:Gfo/Idh/MocA family protein [Pseudobacter ginsenosidimutans]|uniref:Putative dehydrogenase n=1 Tax=Pseudobacter ginsenosidimutans TaxID=661488 RepID=A0A4Q7MZS2_9BACT|nr:Gfo/Idh/MocA family oxidoreductase [Pseudobacter ginsenosidimutans]QEC43031.1 Gfo/Idh/MocA family oxidoreductase [Pseudobacter ginsenosidimutans]RZS74382.1 putative dehydrogenase [Pseudobacter ginsenosidimutans]
MDEFLWGVIGTGNIAEAFAEDLHLAKNAKHRISAVLSREMSTAREFAEKFKAPDSFDDLEQFAAHSQVNAVYIATPHPMHFEEAQVCLKHKLPVLCEKPMGISKRQVAEMFETAKQYNTFLMEAMWTRFLPSIGMVQEMLQNEAIGELRHINASLSFLAPREEGSRYFEPSLGGGSLLDLGIYPVFLSQLLMGKPTNIHSSIKRSEKGIDENCAMLLQFGADKYAMLESSLITQTPNTATITGTSGQIIITNPWNEKPPSIVYEKYHGVKCEEPVQWEGRGLQFEVEEVYDCLRQGKISSEKMSPEFSLNLIETMDTIRHQHSIRYPFE